MQTWGRYGAAGLLVHDRGRVLLQLRSGRVQHGKTWSIPGGALRHGEHIVDGAVREAEEEAGIGLDDLRLDGGVHVAEPAPGWRYTTVLARLRGRARGRTLGGVTTWEVARHEWVEFHDVAGRRLHPGFAASWPELRQMIEGGPAVEPPRPLRVEFVCAGNICRSPVAERLTAALAAEAGVAVEVRSSGLSATVGAAADAGSASEARRRGLDLADHRARRFRASEAASRDLVVVLDSSIDAVIERRLAAWGFRGRLIVRHVPNPWRRSEHAYRRAHDALAEVVAELLDDLQKGARQASPDTP